VSSICVGIGRPIIHGVIRMSAATLADLFHDTLRDVYWAEKHLLKALPKLAKASSSPELYDAFLAHREETEAQVQRLEQVFEMIDKTARAKTCEAMVGLSEEANHVVEEVETGRVRDAGLIAAAQAVEHYEIARYGALAAWAKQLGMQDAAMLLGQTLKEEEAADKKLNALSSRINAAAESDKQVA
jgi:ferritin-like metal-binding protein YciE